MFLMWYDDDKRKSVTEKIADALAAYERRFHAAPNLVLVNTAEVAEAPQRVQIRPLGFIQRSMFYVGMEELAAA